MNLNFLQIPPLFWTEFFKWILWILSKQCILKTFFCNYLWSKKAFNIFHLLIYMLLYFLFALRLNVATNRIFLLYLTSFCRTLTSGSVWCGRRLLRCGQVCSKSCLVCVYLVWRLVACCPLLCTDISSTLFAFIGLLAIILPTQPSSHTSSFLAIALDIERIFDKY